MIEWKLFGLGFAYFLIIYLIIYYLEKKRRLSKKAWEENRIMLFLLLSHSLFVVLVMFLWQIINLSLTLWLVVQSVNFFLWFFTFTECVAKKNFLGCIASWILFYIVILLV
jgi:hypothetical protein